MIAPLRNTSTSTAPPKTDGLNDLDRERAASVADEGGVSAATIEYQRPSLKKADIERKGEAAPGSSRSDESQPPSGEDESRQTAMLRRPRH